MAKNISLTDEQNIAVKGIEQWYRKKDDQVCSLLGYAGTGKTFLVNHIINELGISHNKVAFCTFTGKASLVLKMNNPLFDASTIHRLAYKVDTSGTVPTFELRDKKDLAHLELIVVDEYRMVSKDLYEDLLSFGKPILLIGDKGQLPPIGEVIDDSAIQKFHLTQIHRQAEGNPIIHLSMLAREGKRIEPGAYGKNVYVFGRNTAKQETLEKLHLRADQIICGYNSTRKRINTRTRELLGFEGLTPQVGDKLICLKNSWDEVMEDMPLINGMTGYVEKVKGDVDKTGAIIRDAMKIDFRPDFSPVDCFTNLLIPTEDFTTPKLELEPFEWNLYQRFDFGYAITTHKSQGSQFDNVFVKNEVLNSREHSNWLYTAITRASQNLVLEL